MSASFMVIVSLLYIVLLFAATMYNHKKEEKDLFISSAFALFIYATCHLGNTLWVSALPRNEILGTHYLYFAAFQALLATGLFLINREKMRVIMSITIWLLVVEALLGYAVHLDRNVVALNGAATPNMSISASWLLWDLRNWISQFNTFTVLLALTLPKIYQVKTDMHPVDAYDIQEKVKAYLDMFNPSWRITRANAFLNVGGENLCFFDHEENGEGVHRAEAGIILLNEVIKICCYEPHRTKPVGVFGRFVYWLRS
ncbi:hypothetical protein KIH87_14205 [Paraneptunicella aestuarii]|uniref:hypothetical protein n=1 Tax=Paraneptunicella aestuarii TaxID=2831148 RepID=UPI001E391BC9|nr:hypothetical protein [Paraneptunicella aestuarii]UAA37843.1 hypothetical protein KIH87_14205 [Paraneptunicella aestuarii]